MTANEIIRGIHVGDADDAVAWKGPRLFVGEQDAEFYGYYRPRKTDAHVRILHIDDASTRHVAPIVVAEKAQLDEAVRVIADRMSYADPLLVHCHAGIERSPLTVSYFLWQKHFAHSFDEAFALVQKQRPQAQYRGAWLPRELQPVPRGASSHGEM